MELQATASAKINLALHITGRRDDGMHELDSLVVFTEFGDRLSVATSDRLSLEITGPMAANIPIDQDNLIWRAARLLSTEMGARILLEKRLPQAAGIGGGSTDAATALHLLSRLWGRPMPGLDQVTALGADIPVCLDGHSARMGGVGDIVRPAYNVPQLHVLLINPGFELNTGAVFARLADPHRSPLDGEPAGDTIDGFIDWLANQRNDLEDAALSLQPDIRSVLDRLAMSDECLLARMSGSGATCFGLYPTSSAAQRAAHHLEQLFPHWWVCATRFKRCRSEIDRGADSPDRRG